MCMGWRVERVVLGLGGLGCYMWQGDWTIPISGLDKWDSFWDGISHWDVEGLTNI